MNISSARASRGSSRGTYLRRIPPRAGAAGLQRTLEYRALLLRIRSSQYYYNSRLLVYTKTQSGSVIALHVAGRIPLPPRSSSDHRVVIETRLRYDNGVLMTA